MFYADVVLQTGAVVPLDPDGDGRVLYTHSGEVETACDVFPTGSFWCSCQAIAS
jgi:hypothetical protein